MWDPAALVISSPAMVDLNTSWGEGDVIKWWKLASLVSLSDKGEQTLPLNSVEEEINLGCVNTLKSGLLLHFIAKTSQVICVYISQHIYIQMICMYICTDVYICVCSYMSVQTHYVFLFLGGRHLCCFTIILCFPFLGFWYIFYFRWHALCVE